MPKAKTIAVSASSHLEDRRKFISEAFHSFHQPLTVLHCGLELSLLKRRTEDEYRERLQDALLTAGTILQLNKAVRELVEAADPGENLGAVEMKSLLASLNEELGYTAEAKLIAMHVDCAEEASVAADASKLSRHLGNIAALLVRSTDPGGSVRVKAFRDEATLSLEFSIEGSCRVSEESELDHKLDQIRIDAACSHMWAIGGEFKKIKNGYAIVLPALS